MTIPPWLRTWAGMALIISFLLGFAGTLSITAEIGHPFGGYFSQSIPGEDHGYVDFETPDSWPIFQLDADVDGKLITADGLTYTPNVRATFEQSSPGDIVRIDIIREADGLQDVLEVPVLSFTVDHFLDVRLPELIIAICFWLLAIVVLSADPHAPTNQVFALLSAIIAAQRLLNAHTIFLDNRWLPNILESAHLVASAFIGAAAFHFAWLFPTPIAERPKQPIKIFYIVALIISVGLIVGRVPSWPSGVTPPNAILFTVSYQLLLVTFFLGVLAVFGRLVFSAIRRSGTRRERRVLFITLLGLVVALPVLVLSAADIIPGQQARYFWNNLDLRYLFVAVPLSLALAIIRYQSMRALSPIFIFVAVLAGSALLASIVGWLWHQSLPETARSIAPSAFLPLFITIFAASLFWSIQTTWQGWLGRFFQRDTLNFTATRDLGRRLHGNSDLRELPQSLAQAIADELELNCTAVWQAHPESTQFELSAKAGQFCQPLPPHLPLPAGIPDSQPIRIATAGYSPEWLDALADYPDLEIVMPLYQDNTPIALLGFGPRWDEEIFDDRDLVVIELIGQQALLYLQVARQIEELRQVPHQVSAAQERERTLLAAELHDTIQQFLGRLPFFLVASKEAMVDDPQEAAELLERSLVDIEEAASTVQRIRQNLAPNQLDHSLARSLNSLVAHVQQRHEIDTPLTIDGDLDGATTLETRHALYRVIQHALDNAVIHSKADLVAVDLCVEHGRVLFAVVDSGLGVDAEDLLQARTMGHFGLQSMQARIEAVGGEFVFHSAVGQGTRVSGWVPAAATSKE